MTAMLGLLLCLGCDLPPAKTVSVASLPVDVELVLAVDVSRSMHEEEFALQREGYVAALRHPDFINAVRAGLYGRIALSYFEWAGTVRDGTQVPWGIIDSKESADAFADMLERLPFDTYRGTSISGALSFGSNLFDANDFDGQRQVIDVSGDGPNNAGEPVLAARDRTLAQGIIVNGLPILINPSRTVEELDRYYAECVTGGPGSFVLPIRDRAEFATAIRRKLVLEVSGTESVPPVVRIDAAVPFDCQKGERDRRFFSDPFFPEVRP